MPKLIPLFLLMLAGGQTSASPPANYYLVWNDEFQGSSLDSGKWVYWLYPGNYKDATLAQNAFSESGDHGVITTYTSGGTHFTTMISTQGKFHARYGYFEANIQWADSAGMWSAFWLQSPTMGSYIGDPATGGAEIDTCEHRLQDGSGNNINNLVQANIHWDGYGSSHQSVGSGNFTDNTANLNVGFHKYGVLWTPSAYTIYVDDGQQKWSTSSGLSARTEFMILSSIVDDTTTTWAGTIPSGGYGSLGSSSTKLAVDYVRYYAPNNTIFWTGNNSALWMDSGNWVASRTPANGNDIVFSMLSDGNFSTTLNQNLTINSLSIWETSPVTINSNTLTINSGIDLNSSYNNLTINSDLVLGGANHWTIGSGRTVRVNGTVSGGHSLNLDGYGTAVLSNTNTYTLGTYINRGTLALSHPYALGPTNVGVVVTSGGTLQVNSSFSCNQPLNLAGSGASGNGALRVSAGANAVWTGPITLGNAASINLDGGTMLAVNGNIGGGHTLTLSGDGGSQGIVNGNIATGAFPVTKSGDGRWILAGTNSFTGPLNVDTASSSANDGTLVVISSDAVGTASAIQIQNNSGASAGSTLQLDGSMAGFTVAQPITLAGRNSSPPAIENLAGSNTLSGNVTMNSGGANYRFQSDAGTLSLAGAMQFGGSIPSARTITLQGAGNLRLSGSLANGTAPVCGLAIAGPGTVTVSGVNFYTGTTAVNGGVLAMAVTGSISNSVAIVVTNGAMFDVSGVPGGFVLNNGQLLGGNGVVSGTVICASGATVAPGGGIGTLSFSNNLVLGGGAACQFDVVNSTDEGGGTNDEILVAGALNLSGTNTISINPLVGVLASGRYTLIRYTGSRSGGVTNLAIIFTGVPPQASLALDDSIAGEIDLVVSSFPGALTWTGDGLANLWDAGASSNWLNGISRSAFYPGDSVTFDDTTSNTTVRLLGALAPGLITINGASNYVFTGSGKMAGITGLIKTGSGSLTVLTTNLYSGATEIDAGSVFVGNGATAGSLGSGNIINNGALTYNHADSETVNGAVSGTGSLTKLGAGTLALTGASSYAGGTTLGQGFVIASNSAALGLGPVTINNSATQMVFAAGITLTNSFTVSPGASSGFFASGILKGPASGTATLTGPMTIAASTGAGGHFDGGNSSGGLTLAGPITSSVPVRHRANRVTFAGGGNYAYFWSEGTTVLGATNGLATNAVVNLGFSGAAGILDLAGFSQTLNGLVKGSQAATVGNSSTTADAVLTISGVTSNTAYGGTIQDSISGGSRKVFLNINGGNFTLSAANTFSGDTELISGLLSLTSSTALQNSPLNLATGDTGLLSFGSLTSAAIGGLKGARNLALTNNSGASVALNVGNNNAGTYAYSGTLSGGGSVTKTGSGTFVLSGSNVFTGVLNVDTAQPSSGNDGALCLASPTALNNAASVAIRNQNSAFSTLQLDGSSSDLAFNQPISLNGRNNVVPAIENLAGSNTLAGNLSLGSGGGNYIIQSDSGQLTFGGVLGVHSLTSGRNFTFQGAGDILVAGVITNGSAFANGVFKTGAGTLTLAGTNTYTAATTNAAGQLLVNGIIGTNIVLVTGGTLGGGGIIRGPVTVQAAGALSPGNSLAGIVGALTINHSLVLAGNTLIKLSKASLTNDSVRGISTLICGGALTVTNLGGTLAPGDTFKFFHATNSTGAFTAVTLPPLGAGLAWNTTAITNGVISVAAMVPPQFGGITQLGDGNFQFGGVGSAGVTYELDAAADLTPPVVWSFVTNTVADQNGDFLLVDTQATNFAQRFYRISANQ